MTIKRRVGALESAAKAGGMAAEEMEADATAFSERMTMLAEQLVAREAATPPASPGALLASGDMIVFRDSVLASRDRFLMRAFRFCEPEDLLV